MLIFLSYTYHIPSPILKSMHCPQCNENKNKGKDRKTPLVIGWSGWGRLNREFDFSEVAVQLIFHLPLSSG